MPKTASLVVAFCLARVAAGAPGASALDAMEVLARSESSRVPPGNYAVDFTITVHDDRESRPVRTAAYSMLVGGRDHAIVLMTSPSDSYGAALLIASGDYWLLLPRAARPLQLAREQVIRGDVAAGDLARSNLPAEYRAALDGHDVIDGEPCFRLTLTSARDNARYRRIVSWISAREPRTRRLELYGATGALVRTADYRTFRATPSGIAPDRVDITSGVDPHEITTIAFSRFRALDPSAVAFTPDGLIAFRDSALRLDQPRRSQLPIEAIVTNLPRRVP